MGGTLRLGPSYTLIIACVFSSCAFAHAFLSFLFPIALLCFNPVGLANVCLNGNLLHKAIPVSLLSDLEVGIYIL